MPFCFAFTAYIIMFLFLCRQYQLHDQYASIGGLSEDQQPSYTAAVLSAAKSSASVGDPSGLVPNAHVCACVRA